jgi:hypothetical protein
MPVKVCSISDALAEHSQNEESVNICMESKVGQTEYASKITNFVNRAHTLLFAWF